MMRSVITASIAVVLGLGAALAHAQSFTYQGHLADSSGNPITTPQDFQFAVYTVASGGASVGAVTTATNVTPDNGRFTATVSPGPGIFTGPDRWLQIAVRPAGVGSYTILLPRQKVTPTPYALRSLSDRWKEAGPTSTTNDPALGNAVFLNRSSAISGADFFNVSTPSGPGNYGGMYIETQSGTGLPFYGYATNNLARAWTYVHGTDGSWRLNVGGDRIIVSNTGKLGIGASPVGAEALQVSGAIASTGTMTAPNHTYSAPRTRYLTLGPEDFRPMIAGTPGNFGGEPISDFAYLDASVNSGYIVAPVHLPHGATITAVTFHLVDSTSAASVRGALLRRPIPFRVTEVMTDANSVTASADPVAYPGFSPQNPVVDNTAYTYFVSGWCSNWQGSSTAVASVVIAYTVTEPD
ncbi:MAG: hypothetical protein DYG92_04520 [Leptolyngbya sp. PLA1]|nr:hypothetical protein [Leptolyngbya sp. PLA1]